MTGSEIQAFLSLIKTSNITKSAEALVMTQSALSKKLDVLESELGYKLFIRQRGNRNITLTEKGKAFLPIAEKWAHLEDRAISIRNYSPRQEIKIGASNSFIVGLMPRLISSFMKEYPDVKISVYDYHSYRVYEHIENESIDVGFIVFPLSAKGIYTYPAFIEPSVFLCGHGSDYPATVHPWQLSLSDCIYFDYSKEVQIWYSKWFEDITEYKMFFNSFSVHQTYAFQKNIWTVFPFFASHNLLESTDLETRVLQDGPSDRIAYYVYKEGNENTHLIKALLRHMNAIVSEMPQLKSLMVL